MNCVASTVKYILYVFNLIFVVCGILLIVFGAIMLNGTGDLGSIDEAFDTRTIPIIVIAVGALIFLIAFLGCCGAIRENNCCINMYAVIMFVLLVLQIVLIVWIWIKRKEFLNTMADIVDRVWEENNSAQGYPMDALQISFKCCGVNSFTDYTDASQAVPNSCCGTLDTSATCTLDVYSTKPGCKHQFVDFWASSTNIIRYAGMGVALIEIVAFSFACSLSTSIRKSRR